MNTPYFVGTATGAGMENVGRMIGLGRMRSRFGLVPTPGLFQLLEMANAAAGLFSSAARLVKKRPPSFVLAGLCSC